MWWFIGFIVAALAVYAWFEVRSWKQPMTKDYEAPGWTVHHKDSGGGAGLG